MGMEYAADSDGKPRETLRGWRFQKTSASKERCTYDGNQCGNKASSYAIPQRRGQGARAAVLLGAGSGVVLGARREVVAVARGGCQQLQVQHGALEGLHLFLLAGSLRLHGLGGQLPHLQVEQGVLLCFSIERARDEENGSTEQTAVVGGPETLYIICCVSSETPH